MFAKGLRLPRNLRRDSHRDLVTSSPRREQSRGGLLACHCWCATRSLSRHIANCCGPTGSSLSRLRGVSPRRAVLRPSPPARQMMPRDPARHRRIAYVLTSRSPPARGALFRPRITEPRFEAAGRNRRFNESGKQPFAARVSRYGPRSHRRLPRSPRSYFAACQAFAALPTCSVHRFLAATGMLCSRLRPHQP